MSEWQVGRFRWWLGVVVAVGAVCGGASSASAAAGDWYQFHGNAGLTGFNPSETTLGVANVATLTQSWSDPISTSGETAGVPASPAVVGGVVYIVGNDGTLAALNATSGATVWSRNIGAFGGLSPAVSQGRVIVEAGGVLMAFRATTGHPLWSITPFPFSSACPPTVYGGVIYVCAYAGGQPTQSQVFAFTVGTGSLVFASAKFDGQAQANVAVDGINAYVTVAKDDGTGAVYEIPVNCQTGCAPALTMPTASIIQTAPTLHIATQGLFTEVIVAADKLYAFESVFGHLLWANHAGNYGGSRPNGSSPAVAGSSVYIGSSDGSVYAFGTGHGGKRWATPLPAGSFFASDSPAVANGVVYIGAIDGHLFALNATDGTILWSTQLAGAAQSSPAISQGHVFVGSGSGNLYAFGLP